MIDITKIPCTVRKFVSEKLFPFVSFTIQIPRARIKVARLESLIDTGSAFTVLSPRDALKMQLSFKMLRSGDPVQLAGYNFFRHSLGEATFFFRNENNDVVKITYPIAALIPTVSKMSREMREEIKHIPSIIGNDFLEDNKINLCFNPSAKTAFFET